jgi:hypothetical protein
MSTDREVTRIVRSWLRSDEHDSADRVLDAVLDQLDTTPQRRATWWPARRLPEMNTMTKLSLAAAAVLVAAFLGYNYLAAPNVGDPRVGDPSPSVIVTLSAEPSPSPSTLYYRNVLSAPFPIDIAFEMPTTWEWWTIEPTAGGILAPSTNPNGSGWGLFFFTFTDNLFADPCDFSEGPLQPVPGPGVNDLVQAMTTLPRMRASEAVAIEVDGYSGFQFELTAPDDEASCPDGGAAVYTVPGWEDALYVMSLGETIDFRIVDVDGQRLVIVATDYPQTSHWEVGWGVPFDADAHATHQLELNTIIESIDINPQD